MTRHGDRAVGGRKQGRDKASLISFVVAATQPSPDRVHLLIYCMKTDYGVFQWYVEDCVWKVTRIGDEND